MKKVIQFFKRLFERKEIKEVCPFVDAIPIYSNFFRDAKNEYNVVFTLHNKVIDVAELQELLSTNLTPVSMVMYKKLLDLEIDSYNTRLKSLILDKEISSHQYIKFRGIVYHIDSFILSLKNLKVISKGFNYIPANNTFYTAVAKKAFLGKKDFKPSENILLEFTKLLHNQDYDNAIFLFLKSPELIFLLLKNSSNVNNIRNLLSREVGVKNAFAIVFSQVCNGRRDSVLIKQEIESECLIYSKIMRAVVRHSKYSNRLSSDHYFIFSMLSYLFPIMIFSDMSTKIFTEYVKFYMSNRHKNRLYLEKFFFGLDSFNLVLEKLRSEKISRDIKWFEYSIEDAVITDVVHISNFIFDLVKGIESPKPIRSLRHLEISMKMIDNILDKHTGST